MKPSKPILDTSEPACLLLKGKKKRSCKDKGFNMYVFIYLTSKQLC